MALAKAEAPPHVPYRDATLTKMLKHVLAGNCVNMMLACLNPAELNLAETQNTLRYAQQACCPAPPTPTPLPSLLALLCHRLLHGPGRPRACSIRHGRSRLRR